ncbi:MAG: hypothetical protein R2826_02135 [Thermoleophilia bacterium]
MSKRAGRRGMLAALLVVLLLASLAAGCGAEKDAEAEAARVADVDQPPARAETLAAGEGSFAGGLLSEALGGLVKGAAGEVGTEAMGAILQLLGWGGDSGDTAALSAMNSRLDDIESTLKEIEGELQGLEKELQITEEEILANANDPSGAITEIGTYVDQLSGMADGGQAGGGDKAAILKFAHEVDDDFRIENDVNVIHDAILPATAARAPVLDNYTNLAINSVDSGADLNDAYLGLEQYFTQLVYQQTRGVDLVVEAKLAMAAAGEPVNGMDAKTYMNKFQSGALADEVDNFMENTWRLILSQADLAHTETFLPEETAAIVSRAEFLRTQILLMDHFGLRVHMVTTDDSNLQSGVMAVAANGDEYMAIEDPTIVNVSGPTYDAWGAKSTVSPSTAYQVAILDIRGAPEGDYTIEDSFGRHIYGTAKVQKYDADYTTDADGTIVYGAAAGSVRIGALDRFSEQTSATTKLSTKPTNSAVGAGTPAEHYIEISGGPKNEEYSGTNELDYQFTYAGSKPINASVTFSCRVDGSASTQAITDESGSAEAKISYLIGVHDSTTGSDVSTAAYADSRSIGSNDSAGIHGSPTIGGKSSSDPLHFTPQPGHQYVVYFQVTASGDSYRGQSDADMKLSQIGGLQIRF